MSYCRPSLNSRSVSDASASAGPFEMFRQLDGECVEQSRDVLIAPIWALHATARLCVVGIGHFTHVLNDAAPGTSVTAGNAETSTFQQVLPSLGAA